MNTHYILKTMGWKEKNENWRGRFIIVFEGTDLLIDSDRADTRFPIPTPWSPLHSVLLAFHSVLKSDLGWPTGFSAAPRHFLLYSYQLHSTAMPARWYGCLPDEFSRLWPYVLGCGHADGYKISEKGHLRLMGAWHFREFRRSVQCFIYSVQGSKFLFWDGSPHSGTGLATESNSLGVFRVICVNSYF